MHVRVEIHVGATKEAAQLVYGVTNENASAIVDAVLTVLRTEVDQLTGGAFTAHNQGLQEAEAAAA